VGFGLWISIALAIQFPHYLHAALGANTTTAAQRDALNPGAAGVISTTIE
jgi:hypothetical protein